MQYLAPECDKTDNFGGHAPLLLFLDDKVNLGFGYYLYSFAYIDTT
jgi:hypothetical protein